MEQFLFRGRNLSEKVLSIKRKRPKNAASRDIDCRMFQSVFEQSTKLGARSWLQSIEREL